MELDYSLIEKEIYQQLGNSKIMVLATSYEDRVTARSMSCIMVDHNICFQTDKLFIKTQQIIKNPKVALCIDNIQIEGIAKIKDEPEKRQEFFKIYEKYFKNSYDAYSHLKNQVVIEVEPTKITLWKYTCDHKPYRDFVDCRLHTAYREVYDNSK